MQSNVFISDLDEKTDGIGTKFANNRKTESVGKAVDDKTQKDLNKLKLHNKSPNWSRVPYMVMRNLSQGAFQCRQTEMWKRFKCLVIGWTGPRVG